MAYVGVPFIPPPPAATNRTTIPAETDKIWTLTLDQLSSYYHVCFSLWSVLTGIASISMKLEASQIMLKLSVLCTLPLPQTAEQSECFTDKKNS